MSSAPDDQRRKEAAQRLREARDAKATLAEQRLARRGLRRRAAGISAGAIVALVAGGVGVWAILRPIDPVAAPVGPTTVATPTPTPTPTAGPPPEIVLVGGDLAVDAPEHSILRNMFKPDGDLVAATALGENAGYTVSGAVGSNNQVCIILATEGRGFGNCGTYEEFVNFGIAYDGGGWDVRWWPDGRVEWTGI